MALWDSVSDFLSGGGRGDTQNGYNNANNQLQPYVNRGNMSSQQLQEMQQRLQGQRTQMDQYGNPADWEYKQINQSPNAFYNNLMSGYSESPDAKYAQSQALHASNAGAAASGLLGSGAYLKGLQNNAVDISNRDRQRYLDNILNVNRTQQGYLQNFQGQNNQLDSRMQQILQYLSGLGYGASTGIAQNDIGQGKALGQYDQGAFNDLAGLAGAGAQGGYNSYINGSGGGSSVPQYFIDAALA